MNARVTIRPAAGEDLAVITRLLAGAIPETSTGPPPADAARRRAGTDVAERLGHRIPDGCVLVARAGAQLVAASSLDLDAGEMDGPFVAPDFQRREIGRRMVTETERLAVRFGMTRLRVDAALPVIGFFRACRYRPRAGAVPEWNSRNGLETLCMERSFPRRQTRYGRRIRGLLGKIGIPEDYGRTHRLQLQPESRELVTVGIDARGREQRLAPEAAIAWHRMHNAALEDGIELQIASGFRSVGYQVTIIERKRQAGQSMDEILKVSAAPGFSEHHTGRAIDITAPGTPALEECFESTMAFDWLTDMGGQHGFRMSYPRNNRHGIAYEPWHWAWTG